jgi:ribonuclease E
MPKRMLIDASHPEETRVVVLDGQKVEEFDFEAATRRPLKGNIYLAKVTRVEPSLQAAFVEYGGNRQGFLAFSEIHPDYYQIPVEDRQALLAQQEAEVRRRAEEEFEPVETGTSPATDEQLEASDETETDDEESDSEGSDSHGSEKASSEEGEDEIFDNKAGSHHEEEEEHDEDDEHDHAQPDADAPSATGEGRDEHAETQDAQFEAPSENGAEPISDGEMQGSSEQSAQPLQSQRPAQRWMRKRHYKIQEVIKRRQIILVQVVKEERGNKGAALTTYLSLAGRYCVLMPNTPRGGGISRKITNANDRKRLKSAAAALELPEGMGLIIRTAGENRTKVEIKRDYEYLLRMWDTIRELTLQSNAPACVYEEGDLIKRAIRDLYNKDVAEILVEGDDGYRNAKDFMRMLMPSHAKNVKPYKELVPLFQRHHIEAQLDAMFQPTVTLKSGGYIVINQTEALVSIDVNSGRATREHSIEETAHKTNLEAADEIGRQLRLRDLAGLIVIDFIDMEDGRNDRNVEKRIRDATKNDRARIQIGKISQFGLLEMSRQRLRAGVIAGSTVPCPHCAGQGIVRSVESTALRVLRALEEEGQRQRAAAVVVRVPTDVAVYTLNQKRRELARIETDYGMMMNFLPKDDILAGNFEIERTAQRAPEDRKLFPTDMPPEPETFVEAPADMEEEIEEDSEREEVTQAEAPASTDPNAQNADGTRRKRRRRRRGRDRDRDPNAPPQQPGQPLAQQPQTRHAEPLVDDRYGHDDDIPDTTPVDAPAPSFRDGESGGRNGHADGVPADGAPGEGGPRKRRRRRRGRRREGERFGATDLSTPLEGVPVDGSVRDNSEELTGTADDAIEADAVVTKIETAPIVVPNAPSAPVWSLTAEQSRETPKPKAIAEKKVAEPATSGDAGQTARKGWWQRTFRSDG